jgi:CubicO group peptidase (beta-lactamase class C family)
MRVCLAVLVAAGLLAQDCLAAQFSPATDAASAAESAPGCGSPPDLHDGWTIGPPEQQGLDPARLCAMGDGIAQGRLANVDSIVVVRHGVLVYERYFADRDRTFDVTTRHIGYSLTKSVTSLVLGIAVDRGLIKDLDAPILSFFPEYADLRTTQKEEISLRRLLTMTDGLEEIDSGQVMRATDPYRLILQQKIAREPGTSFYYNSGATELIAAVLRKVTGKTLDDLAREGLFEPLGIHDVDWNRLSNGNARASSGLSLRPRDWAKIGQLALNRGAWQGRQLVSASWIAKSTTAQVRAPEQYLYGFQWWIGRSPSGNGRVVTWTAAVGFNGQKIIVIPALDMVVVLNASHESKDMVAPDIDLLEEHIIAAVVPR